MVDTKWKTSQPRKAKEYRYPQNQGNMADVNIINVQCECYHRRGLLYVARPWVWGRPCRRCRRMMSRNIVVVPAQVGMPVGATTTTTMVPIAVTSY